MTRASSLLTVSLTLTLTGVSQPALGDDSPSETPPVSSILDVSRCRNDATGRELVAALEVDAPATGEVILQKDVEAPPAGDSWVGLRVVDCDWRDGTLRLELHDGRAKETPRALDLRDVPEVVRARTASVALLEWARALTRDTGDAPPSDALGEPVSQDGATKQPATTSRSNRQRTTPTEGERETTGRSQRWIAEVGLGFEATKAPTPASLRLDASLDGRIFGGLRGSVGLSGAHLSPDSRQGKLDAWWWGGELGLGYAWGQGGELSLWSIVSLDGVTLHGSTLDGSETNSVTQPVVSTSLRAKVHKTFDTGLVVGAALDGGWFLQGARFEALGEPVTSFEDFRVAARLLLGHAF